MGSTLWPKQSQSPAGDTSDQRQQHALRTESSALATRPTCSCSTFSRDARCRNRSAARPKGRMLTWNGRAGGCFGNGGTSRHCRPHPLRRIPSGDKSQPRLRLPARATTRRNPAVDDRENADPARVQFLESRAAAGVRSKPRSASVLAAAEAWLAVRAPRASTARSAVRSPEASRHIDGVLSMPHRDPPCMCKRVPPPRRL